MSCLLVECFFCLFERAFSFHERSFRGGGIGDLSLATRGEEKSPGVGEYDTQVGRFFLPSGCSANRGFSSVYRRSSRRCAQHLSSG